MAAVREEELFKALKSGVINFDEEQVAAAARSVVAEQLDAAKAIFEDLVPGMKAVDRLYELQEYFVPELLMSADALYAGMQILEPHIKGEDLHHKGVVLIGVVEGDVHDIGKNMVKTVFEVSGFKVHDLGRNVPVESFVNEQQRCNADLICLSAMMTTTMPGIKDISTALKKESPHVCIMAGGAPLTAKIAEQYGADGYARDAHAAVKVAKKLLQLRQTRKS